MKETVLDVLMYLFDNYEDDDVKVVPDQDTLRTQLHEAGFAEREVEKAFDWLEGLATHKDDGYSGDDTGASASRILKPTGGRSRRE